MASLATSNPNNFGVKRLMKEYQEFLSSPSSYFHVQPCDDNLFEWHFTIRGAPDTDYAGGRYHGRILLPSQYPFKPPDIMLLTPSGRFQCGKKICLSISSFHPKNWQPSWSIRTVLTALIAFFPTPGAGAIGSLDYSPAERRVFAQKSSSYLCQLCGKTNEQMLPGDLCEEERAPPSLPQNVVESIAAHAHEPPTITSENTSVSPAQSPALGAEKSPIDNGGGEGAQNSEGIRQRHQATPSTPLQTSSNSASSSSSPAASSSSSAAASVVSAAVAPARRSSGKLSFLLVLLTFLIVAILVRKFYSSISNSTKLI